MVIDAGGPSIGPSVAEILASHASGTGSPTKTAARVADAIAARGDDGTWLSTVPRDQLLAAAEEIENRSGARTLPLYGVPFGVKDSVDVEGVPTTLSCPDYAYVASTTAPVVRRLLDAGALYVGKTNLDQFATGLNGTRTPHTIPRSVFGGELISGGSSSGSALAVALGQVPFAVATDTAGSGRVPAALNGVVGFKPSRSLISTVAAIPLGVYNFTEAMSNVESAAAAGDNFNLRSVLLADGAGAVIGSAFGSPFPPAVYIGHPGWKDAGGRAGYSLANGVVIGILCFLGLFGVLDALLPVPAIVPILLYIGLLIGAQAFQAVPRLHAVAVVAAILPNLAQWASGLIDNALNAAGTSAAAVGTEALNGAGVVYEGLQTLGEGAVLVGLILGTMVTFILEKKFLYAAVASAVGAVLSFIGLIHAPEVAWAANPSVALGYVFFGIVCAAYSFLPGAKDPVDVDESNVVAGH